MEERSWRVAPIQSDHTPDPTCACSGPRAVGHENRCLHDCSSSFITLAVANKCHKGNQKFFHICPESSTPASQN